MLADRPDSPLAVLLLRQGPGPAVGRNANRYFTERAGRGEYSREFDAGLRAALAASEREIQQWVENRFSGPGGGFVINEVDVNGSDVPPWVKAGLSNAEAATLNGYKILYAKGKTPSVESLTRAITHVAIRQAGIKVLSERPNAATLYVRVNALRGPLRSMRIRLTLTLDSQLPSLSVRCARRFSEQVHGKQRSGALLLVTLGATIGLLVHW